MAGEEHYFGELHRKLMSKLIEKALAGETAPLIFSLKILYGYRDSAPPLIEHEHRVTIELPASLPTALYEKTVNG